MIMRSNFVLLNLPRFALASFALAAAAAMQASTINTSNPAQISNFQNGATVENFDSLTALEITSYATVTVPAANQFNSRDINNPNVPEFNSGGATFTDPKSNPGTPVGVFDPQGGIASDVTSQQNVIGPLIVGTDQSFGTGFMEVIFKNPVSKIGLEVTHGSLVVFLKDVNNSNLSGSDATLNGTAGNFVGSDRGVNEIGGLTILSTSQNDTFTLDDFTFATATTGNTVPDGGATVWNFAIAGVSLWLTKRKLKSSK